MRMLNPLSPQLISLLTGFTPLLSLISSYILFVSVPPKRCVISIAALSSLLWPGSLMILFPFAAHAAAQARCIELFDPFDWIFPHIVDGCIVTFIAFGGVSPAFFKGGSPA